MASSRLESKLATDLVIALMHDRLEEWSIYGDRDLKFDSVPYLTLTFSKGRNAGHLKFGQSWHEPHIELRLWDETRLWWHSRRVFKHLAQARVRARLAEIRKAFDRVPSN